MKEFSREQNEAAEFCCGAILDRFEALELFAIELEVFGSAERAETFRGTKPYRVLMLHHLYFRNEKPTNHER